MFVFVVLGEYSDNDLALHPSAFGFMNWTCLIRSLSSFACVCLIAFWLHVPHAFGQEWQWLETAGGANFDRASGVAVDETGGIYVVGQFEGTADFGDTTLTSTGSRDVFVAKYGANGLLNWVQRGGGTANDFALAVASDTEGNAYVTGSYNDFGDGADFGTFVLEGQGAFVAKYAPDGTVLWIQETGNGSGNAIAIDGAGTAYITGNFFGNTSIGTIALEGAGLGDLFVAKISEGGTPIWATSGGGSQFDSGDGIGIDDMGAVYITGYFESTAEFGSATLVSAGDRDVVIAKLDADGSYLWSEQGGGTGFDTGTGVTVDAQGNVFSTGVFDGTANFGMFTLESADFQDAYVLKHTPDGSIEWVQHMSGPASTYSNAVAGHMGQGLYATGYYNDSINFGDLSLMEPESSVGNLFVVSYDADGSALWAQQANSSGLLVGGALAINSEGAIYVAGVFTGTGQFGPFTFEAAGDRDMFVAQLNSPTVATQPTPARAEEMVFLSQAWPNPSTTYAEVSVNVPEAQWLVVGVYDVLGRHISTVFEGTLSANVSHTLVVDTRRFPAGTYVLKATGTEGIATTPFVVVR